MANVVASFHAHDIRVSREAIDAALVAAVERIGSALGIGGLPAAEVDVLAEIGATAAPRQEVADQALATTTRFAALLAGGLRTADVAALLGVSDGRVRQKLRDRELYAVDDPTGRGHLFPRFQFERGRPLPGLAQVLAVLPAGTHPLAVESFFVEPNPDLAPESGPAPVATPTEEPALERAGYATTPRAAAASGPQPESALSPRRWLASGFSPAAVAALAAGL